MPTSGAGIYTVWDEDGKLVYVGVSGRNPRGAGLAGRLRSHAFYWKRLRKLAGFADLDFYELRHCGSDTIAAMPRLFALRGAISVNRNDAQDILDATAELMRAIMQRNALIPEEVVSCIFTATNDLNAEFPAVAARALGFDRVPLLCAREIAVPRSLPRVIRVLIHYYAEDDHQPVHVYLGEAGALRADLEAAQ